MPSEWSHTPIDAAPPNSPIDVRVQTPVMKGVQVYLYYREPGQADFTGVLMKRHGPEKIGRIPADAITGKSIQYYIEAKDKTGNVVKNSGTQVDPNIVMIDDAAAPQVATGARASAEASEGGEEVASAETAPRASSRAESENPLTEEERPRPRPRRERRERQQPKEEGPKGPTFDTLGWIGLGLVGGGVLMAGVGGGVSFYIAQRNQGLVEDDASNADCRGQLNMNQHTPQGKCYFNDPIFGPGQTDLDLQNQGQLANLMGIVTTAVGGALIAGGAALMIYDYIKLHRAPSGDEQPTGKKRRASIDSTIHNFLITPVASPTTVGVGAAFTF
jgi:hypothetical protein